MLGCLAQNWLHGAGAVAGSGSWYTHQLLFPLAIHRWPRWPIFWLQGLLCNDMPRAEIPAFLKGCGWVSAKKMLFMTTLFKQTVLFQSVHYNLPPGYTAQVTVTAFKFTCSEEHRGYGIDIRKCRFSDEGSLPEHIFREYSPNLCHYSCAVEEIIGKRKKDRRADMGTRGMSDNKGFPFPHAMPNLDSLPSLQFIRHTINVCGMPCTY